jgi:hypothetical protein
MRFYHFKAGEQFEFEAHIFAPNDRRAAELFFIQSLMNEQSDYQMIWRELDPDEFDEHEQAWLCEALALEIEGVASRHPERGWIPVPPFDERDLGDEADA